MRNRIFIVLFLFVCLNVQAVVNDSASISFNGQTTAWAVAQFGKPVSTEVGARFVPTLSGKIPLSETLNAAFEASFNLNGSLDFNGNQYLGNSYNLTPYRLWARLSDERWELRVGLQKINFGSAKLVRPLMWFDQMDVRDPLQLTNGVTGVLAKYFFKNNSNLWIWGLMGNNQPKGYELLGSSQWKPEIGGRFELPLGPGELALSVHHRTLRFNSIMPGLIPSFETAENRLGLDGKWDLGVGLWFEAGITSTEMLATSMPMLFRYQNLWNIGADYTLPIGSGLGVTAEYFGMHVGDRFLNEGINMHLIGSMFTYPVSLLDNLSAMVFWLPQQGQFMNYLNWGRTYDNWSLYVLGYNNPNNVQLVNLQLTGRNLFAGKGIQCIVNYNF